MSVRTFEKIATEIERLTPEFNLKQHYKNREWLYKQVRKGRISTQQLTTLDMVMGVLNELYPDNWDIHFNITASVRDQFNTYSFCEVSEDQHNAWLSSVSETRIISSRSLYVDYLETVGSYPCERRFNILNGLMIGGIYIVIRFPEVTIRNSQRQSMVIRDLFVRMTIGKSGNIENIEGSRTTFTPDEFVAGYLHSHLSGRGLNKKEYNGKLSFTKFCTGTGEIKEFKSYFNSNKDIGNLTSFFLMLQSYVAWESLEGGPHMRIAETVGKDSLPGVELSSCFNYLRILVQYHHINNTSANIDWIIKDGKLEVVDNERFEDFVLPTTNIVIYDSFICYKDEKGEYYVPTNVRMENTICSEYIPFRGEKRFLQVVGELRFEGEVKRYLHPKIKNYVKHQLQHTANKSQVRADTIRRYS